jgi:hypothetical protein
MTWRADDVPNGITDEPQTERVDEEPLDHVGGMKRVMSPTTTMAMQNQRWNTILSA